MYREAILRHGLRAQRFTNARHLKSSIQHFVASCSLCQQHSHAIFGVRKTFRHHACCSSKPRRDILAAPGRYECAERTCSLHGRLACSASSVEHARHRVVFLGTPEVASSVLEQLLKAADEPEATFEVAAIVTQPGRPRGRGSKKVAQPSPVAQLVLDRGWPEEKILSPVKASEELFLEQLAAMEPDLCITAAYGNILPSKFLAIPRFGTLNIHPSLLPKYRGAAPVQRAVQDGVRETGVTVAFTVRAMDAGPVLAQERVTIDDEVQAPQLLADLFRRGTDLLLSRLHDVWSGRAAQLATPQDDAAATHAAKLEKADGQLDFREDAVMLHNKVRAFVGWPGTQTVLCIGSPDGTAEKEMEVKLTRTRVVGEAGELPRGTGQVPHGFLEVSFDGRLLIPCGGSSVLEVLELQPAGKKPMPAGAFWNGVKGRSVFVRVTQDNH